MTREQLIKFIMFPIVIALIVIYLTSIFVTPGTISYFHFSLYYKEKQKSLDFVAVGPSTVFSGFIPTMAWKDHGYTSYNYSSSMQHTEVTKMSLIEIMRTQTPKSIMVDINNLTYSTEENKDSFIKEFFDSIPDSDNKTALMALHGIEKDSTVGLYKYHSYWTTPNYLAQVEAARFYNSTNNKSILKGFATRCYKTSLDLINPEDPLIIEQYSGRGLSEYSKNNLLDMLEYARTFPETEFTFVKMPRFLTTDNITEYFMLKEAWAIIEQYNLDNGTNFKCYDFSDYIEEIGLVNGEDFYDYDHMNYYGARKFTNFISDLLMSKYALTAHDDYTIRNYDDSYVRSRIVFDHIEYQLEVDQGSSRISEVTAFQLVFKPELVK